MNRHSQLDEFLPKSIFNQGFFLSPLAGYTNLTFRRICFDYGCQYTFCEMISAHQLASGDPKKYLALDTYDAQIPAGLQFLTNNPLKLKEAIELINSQRRKAPYKNISSFCLNLGCPQQNKSGAYLLDQPALVESLFAILKKYSRVPVSAKIRLALNEEHKKKKPYLQIAKLANKYLDFLIVHGRTLNQYYGGTVDLESIREIKKQADIPIVGNGDVKTAQDAETMFQKTGCDAIMIGRAAMHRPYVFEEMVKWKKGKVLSGSTSSPRGLSKGEVLSLSKGEVLSLSKGGEEGSAEEDKRTECIRNYLKWQKKYLKYNHDYRHIKVHLQTFLKNRRPELNRQIDQTKDIKTILSLVRKTLTDKR